MRVGLPRGVVFPAARAVSQCLATTAVSMPSRRSIRWATAEPTMVPAAATENTAPIVAAEPPDSRTSTIMTRPMSENSTSPANVSQVMARSLGRASSSRRPDPSSRRHWTGGNGGSAPSGTRIARTHRPTTAKHAAVAANGAAADHW